MDMEGSSGFPAGFSRGLGWFQASEKVEKQLKRLAKQYKESDTQVPIDADADSVWSTAAVVSV